MKIIYSKIYCSPEMEVIELHSEAAFLFQSNQNGYEGGLDDFVDGGEGI